MTCRKNGWSLDRSTLYTKVTKFQRQEDVSERPSSGALVYGLYLEGGAWNLEKSCLERQKPKQLVQELPVLQIIPIESHKLKLQNTFRTPGKKIQTKEYLQTKEFCLKVDHIFLIVTQF